MTVETQAELEGLRRAGKLAAMILSKLIEEVRAGVTTAALDAIARDMMTAQGAKSAPIVTYDFPGWTCISINEVIAHGIPSDEVVIQEGDVVNVDVSLELDGFFADNAATVVVGDDAEMQALIDAARRARDEAIAKIRPGMRYSMIGRVFQHHAKQAGAKVVRDLCSHGIGRALHEPPSELFGYFAKHERRTFHAGQVVTIEPFLSTGRSLTLQGDDGWALLNNRGGRSAQFEHTIVVREGQPPEILTAA